MTAAAARGARAAGGLELCKSRSSSALQDLCGALDPLFVICFMYAFFVRVAESRAASVLLLLSLARARLGLGGWWLISGRETVDGVERGEVEGGVP